MSRGGWVSTPLRLAKRLCAIMRLMRQVALAAVFLLAPIAVSADLLPTFSTIELGMTPQYPRPGETVTLTAVDYSGNANSTVYIWSVDDTVVLSGIGAKTLSIPAGAAGSAQTVSVIAEENGSAEGAATAIVRPADVDLVWEAETLVPPFYIGRPLPNGGSTVRVLAVPHIILNGIEASPNTLIYTWKENSASLGNQSGYGKSSIVLTPPAFSQSFTVSVHVQTTDGTGAADGGVTIQPQNPTAIVYENAPLLGIKFNSAIANSFPFPGDELSFTAFPLFVSAADALAYHWTLDGQAFDVNPEKPGDVTFRKVGSGTGTHAVTFSFQGQTNFLEHAQSSFTLAF